MSDSRLTNDNKEVITDFGNKVFTIPVTILEPNSADIKFQADYGLCFAGSYLNGSYLADSILQLTKRMELEKNELISFDFISNIVFQLYQFISTQLMQIHRDSGLSSVMFVGYCPETKTNKIHKYSALINDGEGIKFVLEELSNSEMSFHFIGDTKAIEKATSLVSKINLNPYSEFHLMKEIIDDKDISTVGGCIQYGSAVQDKFRLYGIAEPILYEPQKEVEFYYQTYHYEFRGIPLGYKNGPLSELPVKWNKVFMMPFEDKRKELEEKATELNNSISKK